MRVLDWRHRIGAVWLMSLLAIGVFSTQAFAQTTRPSRGGGAGAGGGRGGGALVERMHELAIELNLTDDQKAKLEPIFEKARADFQQAMQDTQDLSQQERRAKMGELRDGLVSDVKAVLTDDQKKIFDEKVAQLRQRGGGQGQGQGQGGGNALRQLRDAITSLELTDDQKAKIETVLRDAQQKVQQARDEAQGDMQAMREKARAIFEEARTQLSEILTPEQREKFREAMSAGQGRSQGAGASRQGSPATAPSTQPAGKSDSGGGGGAMAPPSGPDRLEVGQAAPDFKANKLDGLPVQLASFKDQNLLLVFGSYSSPSFRQRAVALDELRREFGVRVSFLVIYTREAHPAGSWEVDRNRDADIKLADHKDESARRETARMARDKLKLRQLTFAIDSMDDAIARAYHASPNDAAVLIGKDGKVLAYQKWFEPYAMRIEIETALDQGKAKGSR